MPKFYVKVEDINNKIITLRDEARHIKDVLRYKVGDEIEVSDGENVNYFCVIDKILKEEIILSVLKSEKFKDSGYKLNLYQAVAKGDKMDFIIQKAVELGASCITPVVTTNTVVKIEKDKEAKKIARWNEIAKQAAIQSERDRLLEIKSIKTLKDAFFDANRKGEVIICYSRSDNYIKNYLNSVKSHDEISIFIGPEGGFTKEEIEYFKSSGAHIVSIGDKVLRTETAGIVALSIISYHFH